MADNQIRMPMGGAGITRYFDDYKSKFSIRPEHVIVLTMAVGLLVILLHVLGPSIAGA